MTMAVTESRSPMWAEVRTSMGETGRNRSTHNPSSNTSMVPEQVGINISTATLKGQDGNSCDGSLEPNGFQVVVLRVGEHGPNGNQVSFPWVEPKRLGEWPTQDEHTH